MAAAEPPPPGVSGSGVGPAARSEADRSAGDRPGAAVPASASIPAFRRTLDVAWSALPLLLMAALLVGAWWLVSQGPATSPRAAVAKVHEPDYTMTQFTIQRFGPDGTLRTQVEGDRLRHYPDTDTLEVDNARLRATAANGNVTLASGKRALANGDASEVQLFENATVTRNSADGQPPMVLRSEFLHAFRNVEQVRTHLPVTVTQGTSQLHADAMDYDNLTQTIDLKGRTKATFDTRGRKAGT